MQECKNAATSPFCLSEGDKEKTNSKTSTKLKQIENKQKRSPQTNKPGRRVLPTKSISFKANESILTERTSGSMRCKSINTHFKKSES